MGRTTVLVMCAAFVALGAIGTANVSALSTATWVCVWVDWSTLDAGVDVQDDGCNGVCVDTDLNECFPPTRVHSMAVLA